MGATSTRVRIPLPPPKAMVDAKLTEIIEDYQNIPNVPFMQKFTAGYIKDRLTNANVPFEENPHVILVKPSKPLGKKKLLIMAHTDHPGLIFKNSKHGQLLGLIGTKNIITYLDKNEVEVRVYNSNGNFIGKAKINDIVAGPKQEVVIDANFSIPVNSIGMFDIESYRENGDTLELYNADDGLMTSILLYLITDKQLGNLYDIYAAFMKHEEVHQVSSWWLAKTNYINLTKEDYVLNLECLKTESIDNEKYGEIDYDGGAVLQLSNKGCLFGYKNPGDNQLELAIRQHANLLGLKLQIGVIKDSCDSRSFTQFGLTPNICTLTIPNKYKHNGADDGVIKSEEVNKEDISTCLQLVTSLTNTEVVVDSSVESISQKLKLDNTVTDEALMHHKARLNGRLEIAYKAALLRGYFYPQTIKDYIGDMFLKALSYIQYFLTSSSSKV